MDLSLVTETYGAEDQRWIGSAHGTTATRPITLDSALFDSDDHKRHGWYPSGLPVGRVNGSGLYGPYDPDADDGTEVLAGFLLTSVPGPKQDGNPVGAALFEHGKVNTAALPVELDSPSHAQRCVAGRIIFTDRRPLAPVEVNSGGGDD